jgi:hypothetical protein
VPTPRRLLLIGEVRTGAAGQRLSIFTFVDIQSPFVPELFIQRMYILYSPLLFIMAVFIDLLTVDQL